MNSHVYKKSYHNNKLIRAQCILSSIKKHNFITIKINFKSEKDAKNSLFNFQKQWLSQRPALVFPEAQNFILFSKAIKASHSKAAAENLSNAYKFSHKTSQSEPSACYHQFKKLSFITIAIE